MARQAKITGRTPEYEGWQERSNARVAIGGQESERRGEELLDFCWRAIRAGGE